VTPSKAASGPTHWGPEARRRYPHVQVKIGNEITSPVDAARQMAGPDRRVEAHCIRLASGDM
jgi:hypothetical protein